MDKLIYGGDSETNQGEPLSFQFYSEDVACDEIIFTSARKATRDFLRWCGRRRRNIEHVVYVHNLDFDLPEFFWGNHKHLIAPGGEFYFKIDKWHVRGVYGSPTYCRVSNGHDISVMLIDSFSFFRGSLLKAADLFCPDLPKLKRPKGLGEKAFTARDSSFVEYAMRDSVITYHIGRALEKIMQEFDIGQAVSVADMAARIFKRRYLTYTIPQPERDVIEGAFLSYHGGKNNITVGPGWYTDVSSLDISSAYPHAMATMPAFSNEKLYKSYRAKAPRRVPEWGVYEVSGKLAPCKWPVIFSHGFKPLSGAIDRVWVHGQEVNEAIASGELKPARVSGHYYDHDHDLQASAFRFFVEDFYRRKETEKDKVQRKMYKFILNSISGKLIQTRKVSRASLVDIDAGTVTTAANLIAGGMFHPFIASGVTAHTRAKIHALEHQHKAIHTATDGIFVQGRPKGESPKLGAVTCEARGDLLLIRNKLYILYGPNGETPSRAFKGKRIAKSALHGFQGSAHDLEKLIASGRRKYTVNKPNRLKDSLNRGLVPNLFVQRPYTLKVGPLQVFTKPKRP